MVVALSIVALLAVPTFVIYQASSGGGNGSSSSSSRSSSSTQLSPAQQQVGSRVQEFARYLSDLYPSNLASLYAGSAVMTWSGKSSSSSLPFKAGTYRGENISALYTLVLGDLAPAGGLGHPLSPQDVRNFTSISSLVTNAISPGVVNATFRLTLDFSSGLFGNVNATAIIQQQWTSQNTGNGGSPVWYVSRDSWNFVTSYVQYPAA